MSFLEPLLHMSLAADPDVRLLVQKILHTLIDRHHNLEKLLKPTYVSILNNTWPCVKMIWYEDKTNMCV